MIWFECGGAKLDDTDAMSVVPERSVMASQMVQRLYPL